MLKKHDTVLQLTSQPLSETAQQRILNDFAEEFGWRPSDHFFAPDVAEIASAHLLVEHGLENTAVLTFLRNPREYSNLNISERNKLLALSYNNLVDWHIPIGATEVATVYNRVPVTDAAGIVQTHKWLQSGVDQLRSEIFEQITDKRPNPNLPTLDDALIATISGWKRKLSAELNNSVSTQALSALFNAIIFARAVEDHTRRLSPQRPFPPMLGDSRLLLTLWGEAAASPTPVREIVYRAISALMGRENIPAYLLDEQQLAVFDNVDPVTIRELLTDFYRSAAVPYEYDFSVMSKHALSRIYEHYVSILRNVETPQSAQPKLFSMPALPEEEKSKAYGGVYTPQFIARFFAKFLREQMPHGAFMKARSADPACGSGIFLRTLLELRFEPIQSGVTTGLIHDSFKNVLGLDIDINAAQATRLSLALLSLALTDTFPKELNIEAAEGIEYFQKNPDLQNSQDAVIANPPFVPVELQPLAIRERITAFMAKYATGRIDTFLAFLRIGLEMLKPGGFGLFVLPHSFLLSKSGSRMRQVIAEQSWIHFLADLSAIRVFGDTSSYVVLIIFQKKPPSQQEAPPATIVKCQDLVGRALQDALDGRYSENESYSVYEVEQQLFQSDEWTIVPPTESSLKRKFERLPILDKFLHVRQGFVSGADDIFIISADQVPEGEDAIFAPYLPDREMRSYVTPNQVSRYFFYPYLDDEYISESELKKKFPETWAYLLSHKKKLSERSVVRQGQLSWWKPVRPRAPERMMRSKIISPHLVIVPRFSLDINGKYAISRSPLFYPKDTGAEEDLLRYFAAVLNSHACYWYIATHSHVYQKGYSMLEVKTLKQTPVPDPARVPTKTLRQLLKLVDKRLSASGTPAMEIERQLDEIVADLYELSSRERLALGMEKYL